MAKLREALIHDLHPTQITVGMIEVHDKKKHLAALSAAEQKAFMQAHPIPAVVGPAGSCSSPITTIWDAPRSKRASPAAFSRWRRTCPTMRSMHSGPR